MIAVDNHKTQKVTLVNDTKNAVVAIVDDDPNILHALAMWIELQGYFAACYISAENLKQDIRMENGKMVLYAKGGLTSSFRLAGAILDLNLPGASGVVLANDLRNMDPYLSLTLITALRDDERARYGNLPQGVPCLKKPFDLDALEDALFPLMH